MHAPKFFHTLARFVLLLTLASAGWAWAQSTPTLEQVYATAQAGRLDDAQRMIQQVLVVHPQSAKAFYVQSELYARQHRLDRARESLATAERLSPGLAFAKPEAVQALRAELTNVPVAAPAYGAAPVRPSNGSSWVLPLLLAGGVIFAGYLMFRRRAPQVYGANPYDPSGAGMNGPQGYAGAVQPGYPQQPLYPQGGGMYAPQPQGSGLGGRIVGGVATGLAVGAGVMAAEAIGRNLMGEHQGYNPALGGSHMPDDVARYDPNADMGGNDFGINDASSWDSGSAGGGGDWDN